MAESAASPFDVAIVGGGPAGATVGTLLKKYAPDLRVLIVEKERFPRAHVGESQLPPVGAVLAEMGVWDRVEAANFPIKFGATYTWGQSTTPWTFGFIPVEEIPRDYQRPGRWEGWRQRVALQVDRAEYDHILLDHAAAMGCDVRQGTAVTRVDHADNEVSGLVLGNGDRITARHYVDASGNAALIRRALGVAVETPELLKNVAFWDQWSGPDMNAPIWEGGATRVHIRSTPYGWIWFIALGPDRSSVGLVCNAAWFKRQGRRPDALYREAIESDPLVRELVGMGRPRGQLDATTDWSFVAERTHGRNWYLCGESLGFADPILSAGLTLTHTCARHLAYMLLEIDRGEHDRQWLVDQYERQQLQRIRQHIRFADYWYSGNGLFSAIQDNCRQIAKDSGLVLTPAEAFRWLSNGGVDDIVGQFTLGGLDLAGVKQVQWRLNHDDAVEVSFQINGMNHFELDLDGATSTTVASLRDGRIIAVPAYARGDALLTLAGGYKLMVDILRQTTDAEAISQRMAVALRSATSRAQAAHVYGQCIQCLEAMVANGWVKCSLRPGRPTLKVATPREGKLISTASSGPYAAKRQAQAQAPA